MTPTRSSTYLLAGAGVLALSGCVGLPGVEARQAETAAHVEAQARSRADARRSAFSARWEYDFERKALVASVASGPSYLELTKSGGLLRFDRRSLGLTLAVRGGASVPGLPALPGVAPDLELHATEAGFGSVCWRPGPEAKRRRAEGAPPGEVTR